MPPLRGSGDLDRVQAKGRHRVADFDA